MTTLYILDGHSLMYRAVYARMQMLTSPTGEPTKGTYVFYKLLSRLTRDRQPDYLCMAVDVRTRTLERRRRFPTYKSGRKAPEDDVSTQLERMQQLTKVLGVPILSCPGFEADDVIASVAHQFEPEVDEVWIVTGDKDMHQSITDKVKIYDALNDKSIGPEEVLEHWGVPPSQVLDVQTLAGDPTDGVPGVEGIGVYKAAKLIRRYGSLSKLLTKLEELPPVMRKAIQRTDLELMRYLVELQTTLEIGIGLSGMQFSGLKFKRARPLLMELGFRMEK